MSYVVALNDGRVWRQHFDHFRQDSMESVVPKHDAARESQDSIRDPLCQVCLSTDLLLPPQLPANSLIMNPAESKAQVLSRRDESPTIADKASTEDTPCSEVD